MILLNFTTSNLIPKGAIMYIILPTNFVIDSNPLILRINGNLNSGATISQSTYTIKATIA